MTCLWCSKPLGFFHKAIVVCGISHEIHTGWFNNCAAKYKKWHAPPKEEDIRLTFTN